MAADLTESQPAPAATTPVDAKPVRRRPYRVRFLFVYTILAGVLGAAAAGIVLLTGTGGPSGGTPWSTWTPTKFGSARVSQIAQQVSKTYRGQGGSQLLDVIAKAPAVQNVPIMEVAVRNKSGNADEVSLLDSGNSLMLVLCGGGPSCAIAKGAPTIERGRLVRREALELALYTFKYVGSVNYIVAFIPPKKGSPPQHVVYFHRQDFDRELKLPLADTLNAKTPTANKITARETKTIDNLTQPHMFKFTLQQAQQGDAILVLDPAV